MTLGDYVMVEGILGLLAFGALLVWLLRPRPRRGYRPAADDIDRAELEAAEREVRDAGASGTVAGTAHGVSGAQGAIDDAWDDDDWGPGVPRRH